MASINNNVDSINSVTILQEIAVTTEEDDQTNATEEVKELKQKSEELRVQISSLVDQLTRVSAQENLLTKYSGGLLDAGGEASTSDLLDVKTIGMIRMNMFVTSCSTESPMIRHTA